MSAVGQRSAKLTNKNRLYKHKRWIRTEGNREWGQITNRQIKESYGKQADLEHNLANAYVPLEVII